MIQIKRLYLNSLEFVPITLAEAVVVNTADIPGLGQLKITTLEKVLRALMGVVGTNSVDLKKLKELVNTINSELANKQDKLTAGAGITISPDGIISATFNTTLYKVVTTLPQPPSKECENTIYLIPSSSGVNGNVFKEFLCIYSDSLKTYVWELIGEVSSEVDLSGYVTKEEFNRTVANINNAMITAVNVTTSNGNNVLINYTIPPNLYG